MACHTMSSGGPTDPMKTRQNCSPALILPAITLYWFATILCIATKLTFAAEISRARSPQTDAPDLEFITSLRQEEFEHGKVMDIMSHLTDEIGPRLTGSPR